MTTNTLPTAPATAAAPGQQETLLSVQNLHVWFELRRFGFGHAGYVRAVDNVNFSLNYGQTIAVVGESGCGKSSLMKTILGLNIPTKGDVIFQGQSMASMNRDELRKYRSQVGYVQQDPYGALAPFMTVERILEEPLVINGVKSKQERLERIRKVLSEVKMSPVDDYLDKFPHMLSGGQQQRVVIARAMILEPKIIVADEPVSMLDASVRVEILRLLRGLQLKYNLAVIFITHDLSTVRFFSEQIFVMYAGKLIEKSEVNDLLDSARHPYTLALLAASPEPEAKNAHIYQDVPAGEPPSLVTPPAGCRYHPRCPHVIQGVCNVDEPPYFETSANHFTACWLFKDNK